MLKFMLILAMVVSKVGAATRNSILVDYAVTKIRECLIDNDWWTDSSSCFHSTCGSSLEPSYSMLTEKTAIGSHLKVGLGAYLNLISLMNLFFGAH